MGSWSIEQVLALAPDPASAKAGQGLGNPAKWRKLGHNDRAVWGEIQGSGKDPYRTQADLSGPAFHCSCPSHKFPCKHSLGLMLAFAAQPGKIAEAAPPAWVTEWLAKREASAERKAAKAQEAAAPEDPETAAKRESARAKTAAKREDHVREGMEELQVWLGDTVRHGLAHARQH
ncbi:MAG TPA: SWIM zinc finger family protein, partial [Candidatus Sulfotelmatobacter sp.]|nr:SWIM zinc finger family protein [Candidatus Sulfotelmatobacter sp.]